MLTIFCHNNDQRIQLYWLGWDRQADGQAGCVPACLSRLQGTSSSHLLTNPQYPHPTLFLLRLSLKGYKGWPLVRKAQEWTQGPSAACKQEWHQRDLFLFNLCPFRCIRRVLGSHAFHMNTTSHHTKVTGAIGSLLSLPLFWNSPWEAVLVPWFCLQKCVCHLLSNQVTGT